MSNNKMLAEANTIDEGATQEYAVEIKTKSGSSNTFRILDGSESYRKYFISWILCDDDSIKPFIVENDSEGKGVLARIFGDQNNYYRGGYLESKKGQFGKVSIHQAKDPELFKRVTEYWNPAYDGTGTARPKREYIYNALHRDPELIDNQMLIWCDVNRHTKVMRLGAKAFKSLAVVYENDGEFWDYDIIFTKKGTGSETTTTMLKAGKNTIHHKVGPLTEAEKKYERYDLDDIVRLPTAYYVLKNLRNTIERIDAVMGTSFILELDEQAKIEQEEYEKRQAVANQNNHTNVPNTVVPPAGNPFNDSAIPFSQNQAPIPNQIPNQAPIPNQAIQSQHQASQRVSVQETTINIPNQQNQISPDQQPMNRVPANTAMTTCGYCNSEIPAGLVNCPKCNGILMTECDVCHNNFSAFANICPYCNTQYK